MIFWYLNALRTLFEVVLYAQVPLSQCERVWDMGPGSPLPPGKTYEEWYGSFAIDCPNAPPDDRSRIFCYGNNC